MMKHFWQLSYYLFLYPSHFLSVFPSLSLSLSLTFSMSLSICLYIKNMMLLQNSRSPTPKIFSSLSSLSLSLSLPLYFLCLLSLSYFLSSFHLLYYMCFFLTPKLSKFLWHFFYMTHCITGIFMRRYVKRHFSQFTLLDTCLTFFWWRERERERKGVLYG